MNFDRNRNGNRTIETSKVINKLVTSIHTTSMSGNLVTFVGGACHDEKKIEQFV